MRPISRRQYRISAGGSAGLEACRKRLEDARAQADAYRATKLAEAEAQVAALRSAAAEEVQTAKADAMAQLRGGVAQIAVDAASAVMQKPLEPAAQMQVIEDYVNRAGSPS